MNHSANRPELFANVSGHGANRIARCIREYRAELRSPHVCIPQHRAARLPIAAVGRGFPAHSLIEYAVLLIPLDHGEVTPVFPAVDPHREPCDVARYPAL